MERQERASGRKRPSGTASCFWGKVAESLTEYLTKGKQIYVEGRLETRQWDDKDGNKRYTTEIKGDKIVLLGGGGGAARRRHVARRRRGQHGWRPASPRRATSPDQPLTDDDIPF